MNVDSYTLSKFSFKIFQSIKQKYAEKILPGSKILTANSDYGSFVIQEVSEPTYCMQYCIFNFDYPIKLRAKEQDMMLHVCIALRNGIKYFIKGIGAIHLDEGEVAMFHAPKRLLSATFQKKRESHIFEIYFSEHMLSEQMPFFPLLKVLFQKVKKNKPFLLTKLYMKANSKVKDIAFELLHSSYEGKLRQFYFENKVRECLFLLFVHTDDIPNENFHVSVEEKGKVFIVKETLDSNIEKHFTIPELSRLVGMNEFRLKFAFKQTFGMGMFEYQKEKRLKEAKRLIVETDKPAKVVAKLTGYARITSFVTEFRKYFGYTPGSLRRK